MSDDIGGAKSALAAHSKDGSAPGQTPASEATSKPHPASESGSSGDIFSQLAAEVCSFSRKQPMATAGLIGLAGVVVGVCLGRRWT